MSQFDLEAMLQDREARWQLKQRTTQQYGLPLVSLGVNWPGPDKNHPLALQLFQAGERAWQILVNKEKLTQIHRVPLQGVMGPGALYVVADDPWRLKLLTVNLEDRHPLGRLWDFDVYSPDGHQLSRDDLGHSPRRCLLCGQPANVCRRLGTHTVEELVQRIRQMVETYDGQGN